MEGVTITAGAQAAVRQPSTPASGRGDAARAATRAPFHPPFQRREVGVRTKHTTAAERLSSISNIGMQILVLRAVGWEGRSAHQRQYGQVHYALRTVNIVCDDLLDGDGRIGPRRCCTDGAYRKSDLQPEAGTQSYRPDEANGQGT